MRKNRCVVFGALILLGTYVSAQAAPGQLLWSVSVSGEAWANPTVAPDGTIYLATHRTGGVMYAISSAGAILRTNYVRGAVEHAPALDLSNTLYYVTIPAVLAPGNPFTPGRWVAAMNATNFAEHWRSALANGSDNSPWFGPSNRLYTGLIADPTTPFATNGRHFYEFDLRTGATNYDKPTVGWVACPGAVDEAGRVFFGAEDITGSPVLSNLWPGMFYALDASGATQWPAFYASGGDFGAPVATVGGIVYTPCRDKNLYGFRATDGEVVFQRELAGRSWTGCAIGVNTNNGNWILYTGTQATNGVSGPGMFYAIELDGSVTGRVLWSTPVGAMTFGTPALDDEGNVYYTTSTGELEVRDPVGTLLWTTNISAGPGGPTLLNDGTIVVASTAKRVLAFEGFGSHLADHVPWPKYKRNLRNTSYVFDPPRDLDPASNPVFVVYSDAGSPFPLPGTNVYPSGTVVWAQAPDWKNQSTQLVCVGWTDGTGDIPASGSTNRLSFVITTNSSLRWLWATNAPSSESNLIPIHVSIVMHSEQSAHYESNSVLFELNRTNLYLFALRLWQRNVKFDFQSDWTFLTAVTLYDVTGRPETGGTNIVKWMERDLGFAIDPHNHIAQSIYNYADVSALIAACGANPTPIAGGFLAYPATSNEAYVFSGMITGNVYTTYTWAAGTLWGGASRGHSNETNLWFSGIYRPRDATNWWQHQEGNLPLIGGYGGHEVAWTNLDRLIALRDAGQLCTGSFYSCNIMVNMSELSPAFMASFDAKLQVYTNQPGLRWVTLPEMTNIWATDYAGRPHLLPWNLAEDLDTDGLPDAWEVTNFCGLCESDGLMDTDGDEWTDAEEYLADTIPTNVASSFSNTWDLSSAEFPSIGIYNTSTSRLYWIQRTTNLVDGPWTHASAETPGTATLLTLVITNEGDAAFYRVGVSRP